MKHLTLLIFVAVFFFSFDIHTQNNTHKFKDMVPVPAGNYQIGIDSSDIAELAKMGKDVPHMNYSHALLWSPELKEFTSSAISWGTMFATTEITPLPPTQRKG